MTQNNCFKHIINKIQQKTELHKKIKITLLNSSFITYHDISSFFDDMYKLELKARYGRQRWHRLQHE